MLEKYVFAVKIFCVKFGLHLNHSRTENHLSLASLVTRSLGPHQEKVRGRITVRSLLPQSVPSRKCNFNSAGLLTCKKSK